MQRMPCFKNKRKPAGEGRIYRLRLGINPNSSGYGILWGAIFFLPPALIGAFLTGIYQRRLDRALAGYRRKEAVTGSASAAVLLTWGAAWLVFSGAWFIFLLDLMVRPLLDRHDLSYIFSATAAVLAVIPVTLLTVYCRKDPRLAGLTFFSLKTALLAPLLLALGYLVFVHRSLSLLSIDLSAAVAALVYIYFSVLVLLLAAAVLRTAGIFRKNYILPLAVLAYLFLGVVFLFPFPVPSASYNPVGLLFPVWGLGVPYLAALHGLTRLRGDGGENSKDPL